MATSHPVKRGILFLRWFSCFAVLAVCLSSLVSCQSRQAELQEKWEKNPCLTIQYWGTKWKQLAFEERIREAPPELIEKIRIENEINGFSERPVSVKPGSHIFNALKSIKMSLPKGLMETLENQFIGVFSVKNLGSSGYSDIVYDLKGDEKYTLIVLDAELLLNKTANEWATWKVNSAFKADVDNTIEIRAVIENEENDTVDNTFRFLLLHELGHVLGVTTKAHSSWVEWYSNKHVNMNFPFQRLSWRLTGDNQIASLFDDMFPEREIIKVYAFEKSELTYNQALSTFKNLVRRTNFPSFYATQSLWEDFAESFATYVHVVRDKRPWRITIDQAGKTMLVVESCWDHPRCEEKRVFMQKWMMNPSGSGVN